MFWSLSVVLTGQVVNTLKLKLPYVTITYSNMNGYNGAPIYE